MEASPSSFKDNLIKKEKGQNKCHTNVSRNTLKLTLVPINSCKVCTDYITWLFRKSCSFALFRCLTSELHISHILRIFTHNLISLSKDTSSVVLLLHSASMILASVYFLFVKNVECQKN